VADAHDTRNLVEASIGFRPCEPEDLPLLKGWIACPHVAEWWESPEDFEAQYRLSPDDVDWYVAQLDGRAFGMIQSYRWADHREYGGAIGAGPHEAGLDYLIGEERLTGRGLGRAMLAVFIDRHVRAMPGVRGIRVDVQETNVRSWRCLEALGFQRVLAGVTVPGEPGLRFVYSAQL